METNDLNHIAEVIRLFEFHRLLTLAIGLVVISYLVKWIKKASLKIQEQFPSKRLLTLQIATVISFCLYIFGTGVLIYAALQPPKELLLALGGSAAVAVGFAMKDLASSVLAGLTLLFDRPFQVGDRVTYKDIYGEIVGIGLRVVKLVTLDDNLVTIPNSNFLTDAVSSGNAGALDMMVVVDFHLSLDSDLRTARDLLYEVVATSRYTYLKKPITIVFSEQSTGELFWVELKVKAFVFDVRYEQAFQTDLILRGNEILRSMKIARPVKSLDLKTQGLQMAPGSH